MGNAYNTGDVPVSLLVANNLSDVTAATARTNLGLGTMATKAALSTRSIWVPARQGMIADGATLNNDGVAPGITPGFQLANSATQGAYSWIQVPDDAVAAQPITIAVYWYPDATDASAHAVQWQLNALSPGSGVNATTAGTTTAFTGVNQVNTAKVLVIEAATQLLASVSAASIVRFSVYRLGSDVADTYTGPVDFLGVRFVYTSST